MEKHNHIFAPDVWAIDISKLISAQKCKNLTDFTGFTNEEVEVWTGSLPISASLGYVSSAL